VLKVKLQILLTDVDVTKSSQALSELLDLSLIGLDLLSIGVLGASLLLGVETQVLQEDNLAAGGLVNNSLDLWTDTVWSQLDLLATEELLEFWNDRLQGVLWVDLSIRTPKVGHEDDGLGTVVDSILDGWKGTNNTLVVGDVLVGV